VVMDVQVWQGVNGVTIKCVFLSSHRTNMQRMLYSYIH
jgi:hypothetical protein